MVSHLQTFHERGIRFQYPGNWKLECEESASGWTVSLQSPTTALLLISFDEEVPAPDAMLETALTALRSDYPQLEAEEVVATLAGLPALGYQVQFISLDLINTCLMWSFGTATGTMLVLWQATDLDLDDYEPVLRAICVSLQVDAEV